MPETVDDGTDVDNGKPALRVLALLHLTTIIVLMVVPLVIFMVLFPDFFTRLCFLASMVDVVSTEDDDDDEPSRVNEQSIRMDTYGEATLQSFQSLRHYHPDLESCCIWGI